MKKLLFIAACVTSLTIQAQIWEFDLGGLAGPGLLGGNEPGQNPVSSASGGELRENFPQFPSISYNVATRELRLPIAWGIENGYTDLTGNYTAWHIHGPVAGEDLQDFMSGTASPLPTYTYVTPQDQSEFGGTRSGSFDTTITLQDLTLGGNPYTVAQQEQDLRDGRWYINVHSTTYGPGEIRGQLLYVIPEPEHYAAMAGFALLAFAGYRRYKNAPAKA
jgi:hypothetical protein